MILAGDIGNTTITFASVKSGKVRRVGVVETNLSQVKIRRNLMAILRKFKQRNGSPDQVVLCSVVPKIVPIVCRVVEQMFGQKARIIGKDIAVPIVNNYQNPRQVGQDRLVCAYAAKLLYGAPAIIIDFGTAITFDVVSARGSYEGGMIIPGMRLSAESLSSKTALLPKIESIRGPQTLIGKNTTESILSGLFNGYGAMACGLISRISQAIKGNPKVIMTGGYTRLMKPFIGCRVDVIDDDLVFKGIDLAYRVSAVKGQR